MKRFFLPLAVSLSVQCLSASEWELRREIDTLKELIRAQQEQINALATKAGATGTKVDDKKDQAVTAGGVKMKVGGYVKIATHFDDNGRNFATLGSGGVIGSGPVAPVNRNEDTFTISPHETRLNLTATGEDFRGYKTKGFIEAHWWQDTLALRHAFINLNKGDRDILLGQTWTTFGSASFIPEMLDFGVGIRTGGLFSRPSQLRISDRFGDSDFKWTFALENDANSAQAAGNYTNFNSGTPWRVLTLEYNPKRKDAHKAVYWHSVINSKFSVNLLDGSREDMNGLAREMEGWAFNAVYGLKQPKGNKKDGALTLAGSVYAGTELGAFAAPAFGTANATGLSTIKGQPSSGFWASLDWYPKDQLRVAVSHGKTEADIEDSWNWAGALAGDLSENEKTAVSLIWQYDKNLRYGIEFSDISSNYRNANGTYSDYDNRRLTLAAQYSF